MKNYYSQKQKEEINVTKLFLQNNNIDFQENDILPNKEQNAPVDIFWKNKKIQVVIADGQLEKFRRTIHKRGKYIELPIKPRSLSQYIYSVVKNPLEKHKFGQAAKGIICLLYHDSNPPFIIDLKESFEEIISDLNLEQYYFDKIILVCPNKNYQLFPS